MVRRTFGARPPSLVPGRVPFAVLLAVLLAVSLAGCGTESARELPADPGETSAPMAEVARADAEAAFGGLGDLAAAWKDGDCAEIERLTTWAEQAIGSRVCAAAREGRAAPGFDVPEDPEFLLPAHEDGEDDPWFAVLARKPTPAYFVFVRADGAWRLGAGPIPLDGEAPEASEGEGEIVDAAAGPGSWVGARLVSTRHVAFLTDPAGVSGVRFVSGDPMRGLLGELVRAPGRVRPDRLSTDVRIEGPARALALPDGGALVFHALRLVFIQKPGPGRPSLAHRRYGAADVRAFTGGAPKTVTGAEIVLLATRVGADNRMTTVGMRRVLADITEGDG
ncbi:hypothetical protein F5972_02185 [Microbispora cellulosiformans]|uniref:Uncharacterized protein n=1 Tax=Microbispora cellulosiformans TaxID=2614688 RepID=A0A5J5KAE6_9ACTN|nr:hypothetical protein [Microbispora cellulosiformans]KAA9381655.1 hypothetical protein F5972_02185 [Microbispora cellulosiformans]